MSGLLDKLTSMCEAYNTLFHHLSRPVADAFGLKHLGPHFGVLVLSFIFFNLASTVLVPRLSRLFFNRIYGALDARSKNKWCVTFLPIPLRCRAPHSPGFGNQRGGGKRLDFLRAYSPRSGSIPRN